MFLSAIQKGNLPIVRDKQSAR